MRKLLLLLVIAGGAYAWFSYVPSGTAARGLAAVGLDQFVTETVPGYLRAKLSIPTGSAKKRERLIADLSTALDGITSELGSAAPSGAALPPAASMRRHIGKSRDLAGQAQELVRELRGANAGDGIAREAAGRLLDRILPASPAGDISNGAAVCPPK